MAEPVCPDVVVYVCHRSIPEGGKLPNQWKQDGAHVVVHRVPCSGKSDAQYLLHAMEGGGWGLCVVTCPKGICRLAQGNYRAEIRLATVRRLLGEIGLEPERAQFVRCQADTSFDDFERAVHKAVGRICALGESPIRVA
jgi:coenzyme F420-reducing hydrogenase delta subunit